MSANVRSYTLLIFLIKCSINDRHSKRTSQTLGWNCIYLIQIQTNKWQDQEALIYMNTNSWIQDRTWIFKDLKIYSDTSPEISMNSFCVLPFCWDASITIFIRNISKLWIPEYKLLKSLRSVFHSSLLF